MENEFYEEDDFTQFLKDSTEDFKMYPGRRIWHSLYKDMHPSQKWPSIAVCLLLISSIVYLGIANNNTINKKSAITITERKVPANSPLLASENKQRTTRNTVVAKIPSNDAANNVQINTTQTTPNNLESDLMASTNSEAGTINAPYQANISLNSLSSSINDAAKGSNSTSVAQNSKEEKKILAPAPSKQPSGFAVENNKTSLNTLVSNEEKKSVSSIDKPLASIVADDHRSFMEDDIFYNLKRGSLFKKKTSLHYYVTPSVGFRTLKQKTMLTNINSATATPLSVSAPVQQGNINDKVSQSYAVNMEAGAGMSYKITKKLALTAGVQFNYTNYVSYASRLQHTEVADLYLVARTGNYEEQRASSFANTVNSNYAVLNNTTVQFSVPVGLEYNIVSGKKITWQIGGTLQPGIIASGKGYALSSDNTHYIEDKTLLSNTVLNSSLQTTISYRTKNGVSIFAGPQMRYQLTDTHKSKYNYSERLYNYGVKLGFSRNL
jgi:hypothetical protein